MSQLVLEYHKWRKMKCDDEHELAAMYLFSLLPRDDYETGRRPTHNECFWTEVSLSLHLAESEGWKGLSKRDKYRAMFQHAVDGIRTAGRMLRQAPLFWTCANGLDKGPACDLSQVQFPKPKMSPILIDAQDQSLTHSARAGAGH